MSSSSGSIEREWPSILICTYVLARYAHCWWNASSCFAMDSKRSQWANGIQQQPWKKKRKAKNCFMFCIHNSHFCHWIVQYKHLNLVVKHRLLATTNGDLLSQFQICFFFAYRSDTSGICSFVAFACRFIFLIPVLAVLGLIIQNFSHHKNKQSCGHCNWFHWVSTGFPTFWCNRSFFVTLNCFISLRFSGELNYFSFNSKRDDKMSRKWSYFGFRKIQLERISLLKFQNIWRSRVKKIPMRLIISLQIFRREAYFPQNLPT